MNSQILGFFYKNNLVRQGLAILLHEYGDVDICEHREKLRKLFYEKNQVWIRVLFYDCIISSNMYNMKI